ncbi:hypothetical protein [Microvirga terricola]|uniref:Uncharacterized protein n=1 Tax=Microvirga terricola TaxID=2719797 RepID=A0ABX0V5Y7_9HYPH|nr:hypothetical protein [Microvirga terricola]NIX75248.1 hypothetical protein [Microvirga terricola]
MQEVMVDAFKEICTKASPLMNVLEKTGAAKGWSRESFNEVKRFETQVVTTSIWKVQSASNVSVKVSVATLVDPRKSTASDSEVCTVFAEPYSDPQIEASFANALKLNSPVRRVYETESMTRWEPKSSQGPRFAYIEKRKSNGTETTLMTTRNINRRR